MPLSGSLRRRMRRLKGANEARVLSVLAPSMTKHSRSTPFWARMLSIVATTVESLRTTVTTERSTNGTRYCEDWTLQDGFAQACSELLDLCYSQNHIAFLENQCADGAF